MIASSVLFLFSSVLAGMSPAVSPFALEIGVQHSNPMGAAGRQSLLLATQTISPRAAKRLRDPNSSTSSSSNNNSRVRGRSYRGLIRIGIFAVILLFGLGGWIVKNSGGNQS